MESVISAELEEVVNTKKNNKKAGYQEGIVDDFVGDIELNLVGNARNNLFKGKELYPFPLKFTHVEKFNIWP